MTVGELIAKLQEFDPDLLVVLQEDPLNDMALPGQVEATDAVRFDCQVQYGGPSNCSAVLIV